MEAWFKKLLGPTGILVSDDRWARRCATLAQQCGLRVPNDVAILGIGNSPFTCRIGGVGLSSIALPAEAIGRQAAAVLDGLLAGKRPRSRSN